MSTFDYLKPDEAVLFAGPGAREQESIVGRRGADADLFMRPEERTRHGYLRIPADPWRAHAHLNKFREITSAAWAPDADQGTALITYTDGTTAYVSKFDLLCVERPV